MLYVCTVYTLLYFVKCWLHCILNDSLSLISSLWYVCCMYTLYTKLFSDSWLVICEMYVVCIHCILNDYLFFISSLWYVCCMYTLYNKRFHTYSSLVLCDMYVVCIHCILNDSLFLISPLWYVCCMCTLYIKLLLILD